MGTGKVISRNSVVYRHPLAVAEPIRFRFPLATWTDEMRADFIQTDWLRRAIERMFEPTPARDELTEDLLK